MRLYYTGAPGHLATQGSSLSSLGGFVSNTPIPSGSVGSIFPDISQSELFIVSRRVVLVALKNTGNTLATNVRIFFTQVDETLYTLEMGAVAPAEDDCRNLYFEIVTTDNSLPIGINFTKNKEEINAIVIPEMAPGSYIGIWIKLEVEPTAKETFLSCKSMYQTMLDEEESGVVKNSFPFDLHIMY